MLLIAHNHLNGILRKVQKFVGFIIRVDIFSYTQYVRWGRAAFKFKMFINCKLISAIYKKNYTALIVSKHCAIYHKIAHKIFSFIEEKIQLIMIKCVLCVFSLGWIGIAYVGRLLTIYVIVFGVFFPSLP